MPGGETSYADLSLADLRDEIDRIDDQIHELIMARADIVSAVADRKRDADGRVGLALRPAREAEIVRRLISRHQGPFPADSLAQIWRELLAAATRMQSQLTIALSPSPDQPGLTDLARLHFGARATLKVTQSPQLAVRALSEDDATIALMGLPDPEASDPWWNYLLGADCPRVVARLPFAGRLQGNREMLEGFVVAHVDVQPSGDDCSLIVIETAPDVSRARLNSILADAGLETQFLAISRNAPDGDTRYLLEARGFIAGDDQRLTALLAGDDDIVRHVIPLGAYAVPLKNEDLGLAHEEAAAQ